MTTLSEKVNNALAGISTDVEKAIIDGIVKREVEKRAVAVTKVYDQMMREEKELRKVDRADQKTFNKDGSIAAETYSKERLDAIKKHNQAIEKMMKAIEKALAQQDFSDVYNLTGADKSAS